MIFFLPPSLVFSTWPCSFFSHEFFPFILIVITHATTSGGFAILDCLYFFLLINTYYIFYLHFSELQTWLSSLKMFTFWQGTYYCMVHIFILHCHSYTFLFQCKHWWKGLCVEDWWGTRWRRKATDIRKNNNCHSDCWRCAVFSSTSLLALSHASKFNL